MTRYTRAIYSAAAAFFAAVLAFGAAAETLPEGFVYLRDVAPSIKQDMRYATASNFTGKPVPGYDAAECVLKRSAAEALKRAQKKAERLGYSITVYDCYRPVRAVRAFVAWAAAPEDGRTKTYYPHLNKSQLVSEYIASQSQHSTGFAVDLTIQLAAASPEEPAGEGKDCTTPRVCSPWQRYRYGHSFRLLRYQGQHGFRRRYARAAQEPPAFA